MLRICLMSLAALLLPSAYAAEPASGTVTNDTPVAEWTGGPYIAPNLTPAVLGQVDMDAICEEGTPTCDVYRFEVNLSSVNPDDDYITITVSWNDTIPDDPIHEQVGNMPDYDLYLYDDTTGTLVTSQATGDNPEIITLPPENRKYKLVVIPFFAANEAYTGKVELKTYAEGKSGSGAVVGALDGGLLGLFAIAGILGLGRRR